MKELDVVMTGYLERYYRDASSAEQDQFRALLAMPDPELYDLLLGRSTATDLELDKFVRLLRDRSGTINKES